MRWLRRYDGANRHAFRTPTYRKDMFMKTTSNSDKAQQQQVDKRPKGQEGGRHVKPSEPEYDPVDEAAEESFPASDPPSFTGATATPDPARPERRPAP
jgi:hypothetical protein